MAASLKKLFPFAAMCCALIFAAVAGAAEQLDDPTRPAIQLIPGLSGAGDGSTPPPVAKGLQSVIISPKREAAIINGVEVEQGKKYGDAVLTEVNETCVVLMGPQGRQVMHMFPTVNMSKNEMACVRKMGVQPLKQEVAQTAATDSAAAGEHTKTNAALKPKAKVKKRKMTCVAVENKDGSGK